MQEFEFEIFVTSSHIFITFESGLNSMEPKGLKNSLKLYIFKIIFIKCLLGYHNIIKKNYKIKKYIKYFLGSWKIQHKFSTY